MSCKVYNVGERAGADGLKIEGYGDCILQVKHRGPFFWMRACPSAQDVKFQFGNMPLSGKWTFFFLEELLGVRPLYRNGFAFGKSILYPFLKNKIPGQSVGICTERLYRYAQTHILCNGIFLNARMGSITVIMGPSGCGKSVFLKMLAGYDFPDVGKISILGETGRRALDYLGFVPQGHAMLSDLTTAQALNYRLSMRFPFLSKPERYKIICRACRLLAIENTTRHKKIGRMEWMGNYPSGGQRRRINIAHELVLQPRVLVLDEPTSGLSSRDSDDLMEALVKLAHVNNIAIVMTLHQPSMNMFWSFDDLLLLSYGGNVCYYGPAKSACKYLGLTAPFQTDVEALLSAVSNPQLAKNFITNYNTYLQNGVRPSESHPYIY